MTIFGALKELICGGFGRRSECIRAWQNPPGTERLNGEKEKLRELCVKYDAMRADMELVNDKLDVIVTAISEAPEQSLDHCAACPLQKMQAGLRKPRRSRTRG